MLDPQSDDLVVVTKKLTARHPEIATTEDGDRSVMSCEELAKLPSGGQVIFTNFMAAALMLSTFWNLREGRRVNEVYFNIAEQKVVSVGGR